MNSERAGREERRAGLVALAEAQRRALASCVEPWRRPLSFADRGIAAMRFIKNHPAWIVGTALAPRALQAGQLGSWLRRAFVAWQVVRRLGNRSASVR